MQTDGKKRSFFDMVFGEGLPGPGTHQGAIGSLFAANRIKSDFFAPWPFHLGADTGLEIFRGQRGKAYEQSICEDPRG